MMTETQEESEKLSEQAIVLYKAIHDQIGFLKKHQWTITNYVVLIYAAIFAVKKAMPQSVFCGQNLILIAATLIAGVMGIVALLKIQYDLGETRQRIDAVQKSIFGSRETSQ